MARSRQQCHLRSPDDAWKSVTGRGSYWRCVATARAIAHAYGAFAAGGGELGLRQETLDLLACTRDSPNARVS